MRAASLVRRGGRLAVIATVAVLALVTTTIDVPSAHTEATVTPAVVPAFAGAELGHAATSVRQAPLICVDPGHSESAPGMIVTVTTVDAVGAARERRLREVDINLDVARDVVRRLRARFGNDAVVMTWGEADGRGRAWEALRGPTGDDKLDLMMRGAFCVREGAQSVVSVHTNWFGDAPNGIYVGYRDAEDRVLAEAIHSVLFDAMAVDPAGEPVAGYIDYGLDPGDWFLMLGFGSRDVPAVILEPVMMSNADEARRLLPVIAEAPDGRRAQIARVEAQAIGDWIAATLLRER
ncbi:MAG: N-acetylmuramoyl-L-alanine amidase [Chloroflexi bacterium]|nr:N-acetylmuramoyl-L-alanine amidase [Chloroflexota bacterium]MDA1004797.1 N-acetylmuramoyl-L-alanine amidase [Chloroflexota bacterium]